MSSRVVVGVAVFLAQAAVLEDSAQAQAYQLRLAPITPLQSAVVAQDRRSTPEA